MELQNSIRQDQFASAATDNLIQASTNFSDSKGRRRQSFSHQGQRSQANGIRQGPDTLSNDTEHDQAHLTRLERVVAERTDNIKDEELAESSQIRPRTSDVSRPAVSLDSTEEDAARGPNKLSDRLMATYLCQEYVNLPIFDLSDFKSAYEASRSAEAVSDSSSPFNRILNILFSLSSLSMHEIHDADELPPLNEAGKLTNLADNDGDSWETLQSYILQSQYFNATGDPKMAWTLIGIALRTAQTLGLQSKTQGLDVYNRKQRELARKLWHSAIIMERMLSLQIGILPQTLNPFRVPLPAHLDTDYVDSISGKRPSTGAERPSIIEFLSACARLYSNVEDILAIEDEIRIGHNGCAAKKLLALDLSTFFKTDSLLYDWNISLPSFLQKHVFGELPDDPIIHRQRNICRIRYLYIRLRLYRPLLIMAMALSSNCDCKPGGTVHFTGNAANSPDSPAALSVVRDSLFKCVDAASELVGILSIEENGLHADNRQRHAHFSTVPSFWENVDYLYACGMILLAARSCPLFYQNENEANIDNIKQKWRDVLRLLDYYGEIYQSKKMKNVASSCLRTLNILSDALKGPIAETDMAAAFDNGTRTRIFQRIGVGATAQDRNKPSRAFGPGLSTGNQSMKGYRKWSWIESLPIDLEVQ